MKNWNVTLLLIFLTLPSIAADQPSDFRYTGEKLHEELEWSGRNCNKPKESPPRPIRTLDYNEFIKAENNKNYRPHYVYWRRWIDIDGDGVCEIFDVNMPERAPLTKRFYGYTTTVRKIENGAWKIESEGGWFPLVLKDKKFKEVYMLISPFMGAKDGYYSALGLSPESKWGRTYEGSDADICRGFRRNIALAYMLTFAPPPELKTDVLMSDEWTGGDEIFAVFNGVTAVKKMAENLACMKPYLDVAADIDKRIRKLYPTYFSGKFDMK